MTKSKRIICILILGCMLAIALSFVSFTDTGQKYTIRWLGFSKLVFCIKKSPEDAAFKEGEQWTVFGLGPVAVVKNWK
jgi:hypothetical protein